MLLTGGFAALETLKERLGARDTLDDAVLTDMLTGAAGAIEAVAGRALRRRHHVVERFAGGTSALQLSIAPVAEVHYVRESLTRDFTDSDNYAELVAGEDYVLDASAIGEAPGASGWIRRLGGRWAGSRGQPAMVEICYTGGYRTDLQQRLEREGQVHACSIGLQLAGKATSGVEPYNPTYSVDHTLTPLLGWLDLTLYDATLTVDLRERIPSWTVTNAILELPITHGDDGNFAVYPRLLPPSTPPYQLAGDGAALRALIDDNAAYASDDVSVRRTLTYVYDFAEGDATLWSRVVDAIASQRLSLGFTTNLSYGTISDAWGTLDLNAATLTLHGFDTIEDAFGCPDDLRTANLIQAVHDFHTRRNPGYRQEISRGVSVASGVSYLKDPADLLPEVRAVAQRYARLI